MPTPVIYTDHHLNIKDQVDRKVRNLVHDATREALEREVDGRLPQRPGRCVENSGFLGCVIFLNYELTRSVTIFFSHRDLFAKSQRCIRWFLVWNGSSYYRTRRQAYTLIKHFWQRRALRKS